MASSLIFYLKYRPQTLDDLIGQDTVKRILISSFRNNKLSHAYLLVGPRGTGKTSTARILAKMVNCEHSSTRLLDNSLTRENEKTSKPINDIPCNKCPACISITDGSNMDLIEIDAASNRGIEDIRSLRDKIKLAPTAAKKKVYIIDEVHMLTTEAFNALLKTLEEPPAHTIFILATTNAAKIPQTILSRVQRLDFTLAKPEELLQALTKITKAEKIEAEEEALKLLAKKSDGSFRDAVKLLDQVASTGEKITTVLIEQSFKSGEFESVLELVQNIRDKNSAEALLNIARLVESGANIKDLMLSLMDTLRSLVLIQNGVGDQLVKENLTEDKYQKLQEAAKGFNKKELNFILNTLQDALEKLKFASILSLPLELAVVEICSFPSVIASEHSEHSNLVNASIPAKIASSSLEELETPRNDERKEDGDKKEKIDDRKSKVEIEDRSSSPDIQKLKEKWTFVLETIRQNNFSLEALLRSINITECSDAKVFIEVPYSFHQRILEAPKNRDLLEGILSDILGRSIRIAVQLGNRPQRKEDIANIELAQDDEIIRAAAEIFSSDTVN